MRRMRHLQLGEMSALVGRYRPSAADVRPGTEPYERVIRALRGESWNRAFSSARQRQERPFTGKPPVYMSTPLSTPNTQMLKMHLLGKVSSSESSCTVETAPSTKRTRCCDEETERPPRQSSPAATNETTSVNYTLIDHVTSSEDPFEQYVTGPVNPIGNQNTTAPLPPPATTSCTRLTEKLQKNAQLDDEVQSTRQSIKVSQSKAKYKPPYKIIIDCRPGMYT